MTIDTETARLVRELQALVLKEPPETARRALCDILGVLTGHVLTDLEGEKRREMLEASLQMIRRDVADSYFEYLDWLKKGGHR